jgi:monolysocardiolipin acyltransferase
LNVAQEQRAVARWRPGLRWYHPVMAKVVIAASRLITTRLNGLKIDGADVFERTRSRSDRGLLTVSNHVSLFDDPLLIANLVRGPYKNARWVGADALNFFGSAPKAWLFTAGKSVPIVRGSGLDQPGMRFLRDRLLAGDWVHIFPEGQRTRDPDARMASFRPGAGWLIAETSPIVLPFYHYGMHRVLPAGALRPRAGQEIRVVFGEPIDCDAEWLRGVTVRSSIDLWRAISAEIHARVAAIEHRVHPSFTLEKAMA